VDARIIVDCGMSDHVHPVEEQLARHVWIIHAPPRIAEPALVVQVAFQRWSKDGRLGKEAVSVTCLARQTLMDLKYVSGRFEISRRREKLSLSHHREVAPKPLGEQDDWLDAGR